MRLGLYLGGTWASVGVLVACQNVGTERSSGEEFGGVSLGTLRENLEEQPVDTLETYAAKCDAATGIHVPAFSCTNQAINQESNSAFAIIDQGSTADNVESDLPVGAATGAPRVIGSSPTAFTMTASGPATVDQTSDHFYFANTRLSRSDPGASIISFSRAHLAEVTLNTLSATCTAGSNCVPQAGVMIRSSDSATSPFVMLSMQTDGKLVLKRRQSEGSLTQKIYEATGYTLPLRLRLQWDGSLNVLAEVARAGQDWASFGPQTTLPDELTPLNGGAIGGVAVAGATITYDRFYTPRKCDHPNGLSSSCDPESTFQVVERTADAVVVANCRKSRTFSNNEFGDIAVIQYNRVNGATCFYQSAPSALDGSLVPAPSRGSIHQPGATEACANPNGDNKFCWVSPEDTHTVGCTGCHDSTALIRSPYIMSTGLIPETGFKSRHGAPLRYVGHAFADDRSWLVAPSDPSDPANGCLGCHDLAVNNVTTAQGQGGTAYRFATMATTPYQFEEPSKAFDPLFEPKNKVSVYSPAWMLPGTVSYPETHDPSDPSTWTNQLTWASKFRDCAKNLWAEAEVSGWDPLPDVPGCEFEPYGTPWYPSLGLLNALETNIGGGGGDAVGDFDALTITSPTNSDVTGTSDKAYTVSAIMQGDGYLVTKVTSLANTHEYAKAGLMFRESNNANAKNVMLALTAQHGMQLHHRATTGGNTTVQQTSGALGSQTFPVWLRLERAGNTVLGFVSNDERNSWQRVGEPVTFSSFAATTQAVVNTSHNPNATGEASFASFDFVPTQGWMAPGEPHVLTDLHYGASTGKRKEWITAEVMSSKGGDIYGASDTALFSLKSFSGNGELQTIVEQYSPQSRFGKAGLMIRAAGTANAANVFFGRIRDGLTFQYRQTAGGSTTSYNCENNLNLPARLMLRLVRNGTTFTAFYKGETAATWTQMKNCSNNQNLAFNLSGFATSALAGLAVSSETSTATTTATLWSGKTVEPPGFLWSALGTSPNTPEPDPTPAPTGDPCDGFCANSQEFSYTGQNNYQSGSLGTGERCMETRSPTLGGLCGNMSARTLRVNGVQMSCNNAPWSSLPAKVNDGYCIQVTSGNPDYAWFSIYN